MRPRRAPTPPLAALRPSRSWGSQLPGPTGNSESLPLARCREAEREQAPRRRRRGPGLRGSGPHSLHDPAPLCRPGSCPGSAAGSGEEAQRTARGERRNGNEQRRRASLLAAEPDAPLPGRPPAAAPALPSAPAAPARKRFLFRFSSPPPVSFLPRGCFRPLNAFQKKEISGALLFHPSRLLLTLVFGERAPNSHKFLRKRAALTAGRKNVGEKVEAGSSLNAKHQRGM